MMLNKYIDKASRIDVSATVSNNSVVGGDVIIGKNCHIKESVIGPACRIGDNVKIVNCIIDSGVSIENGCELTNCII